MSKEDVIDMPATIPRKRRQVESMPDVWIATWLADDALPRGDRLRLQAEKDRRKRERSTTTRRVGILMTDEGMTPEQMSAVIEAVLTSGATEVHHGGVPRRLHNICREVGVVHHNDTGWRNSDDRNREVIKAVDAIIAAPKEAREQVGSKDGLWAMIQYARHRKVAVRLILPDGSTPKEESK